MPAKLPLLTSAHIVTSFCMPDGELPHVMLRLNDFLDDFSADCTIVDAYRRTSSLGFMQYVAAREDPQEMNPFYRRWLFNAATEMAASRGDLASLRWLMESYLPSEFLTKAVAAAATNGHLPLLKWLFETHHDRGYWGNTELCGALTNNHGEVVQWLRTHAVPRTECRTEVMDAAAGAGYLDIVKWLHDEYKVSVRSALSNAMSNRQWETMLFLHAHRLEDFSFLGTTFVRHSCIELAQWLLCNYAEKLDGCEFEVPTSDWRFNDWCAMINLHRARQYDASTWWVCESAALHLDRQQA
ncbi:Secreted RxLR effector protein 124 [Phytophthora ramorum]|uniref:Secreted RxLR effector protein 124 n=1 Tax=Phytophthora ramorum TaxID=164328 RepID=UPI00309C156E|nr:Secreted RxLR effector protein 124 [Phytophthora ramorum]